MLATPLIEAALDDTEPVAEHEGEVLQEAVHHALALLLGAGPRETYLVVCCLREVWAQQTRHLCPTLLDAKEGHRLTSRNMDAVGELGSSLGEEFGCEGKYH